MTPKLSYYYCDNGQQRNLPAEEAEPASVNIILEHFAELSPQPENYFGVIRDGKTLQFSVLNPDEYIVDIPDAGKGGSYNLHSNHDDCCRLIEKFAQGEDLTVLDQMKFVSW